MTASEVMNQLKMFGSEQTKKIYISHGAKEPLFGVKVADLKTILKKTKKDHQLSLELYDTGNSDAMYLAGLMADESKITEEHLNDWVKKAYWFYLSEYTVPWVAAETKFGFELGLKWIRSDEERIAAAGWSTLSYYASVHPDDKLDINAYSKLLDQIPTEIHAARGRVKYAMNGFIIAIGSFIAELNEKATNIAKKVGSVEVDMNGTSCKVPLASDYLHKILEKKQIGKKRKTARC
ncbi:MAG: DNA alkylation repair protein [Saprospiraceae bacterium]|nr:DNA alkylation repair protein [Candidatus Vicinibacter affinis]MBK6574481.1 DNA alkylation repair protein [Candidatus Vicinibacter affinis]MBK7303169.1 DNA alkylation repair protein [Candidatus Vicinibacter affinis]MBK7799222.1 DNA alkylation repair protein [Candidatus Vicinibacter affinis]MBK8403435.1 DNA alkylation repair protein [Candidatus Vicinibacter affinis]